MGTLIFTATVSIDGFAADADGDFQWTAPDDDVFAFHVERMGAVSTEILGRRTHELMRYWEAEPEPGAWGADERAFAERWLGIDLVVASSTLPAGAGDHRGRVVNDLGLDEIRQIVSDAPGEVEIFGPTTAAPAIRAGLVTDFRFFIVPAVVGGGLQALPSDARLDLRLVENRTYGGRITYLHYVAA